MKDRIKQNEHTGRFHIDGGPKGYLSQQSAQNALINFEKRQAAKKSGGQESLELSHTDKLG